MTVTRGRPFQAGQSPNPGGRPKAVKEVVDLARQHTTAAITNLVSIANDGAAPPAARVAACNAILDRAIGKPKQMVELTGEDGGPVNIGVGLSGLLAAAALIPDADNASGPDGLPEAS